MPSRPKDNPLFPVDDARILIVKLLKFDLIDDDMDDDDMGGLFPQQEQEPYEVDFALDLEYVTSVETYSYNGRVVPEWTTVEADSMFYVLKSSFADVLKMWTRYRKFADKIGRLRN